uniref:Methyltransferase domain-containing protein n=1 Tax=Candidatus Kentrum sp. SD TaxID=2126332 RepID=A0A450YAE7_9GAMM|nr:MAG: Methyltransferase domain-containing protein [Candidatus Kentron sp. SD]VFK43455.1 MAG: Methyltransferase domain-containing protein [Candidatus Kentron sp. SD]VFK80633.1 MAG: Methyltransferase domain-containing protein [Candidatus Kentron sp. SD]
MIRMSDQVAKQAYARMLLNEEHKWAGHTESEVDFIIEKCDLTLGKTVLDMGCGLGWHALALAKRGLRVTGIDYISTFIERAKRKARNRKLETVKFIVADGRERGVSRGLFAPSHKL